MSIARRGGHLKAGYAADAVLSRDGESSPPGLATELARKTFTDDIAEELGLPPARQFLLLASSDQLGILTPIEACAEDQRVQAILRSYLADFVHYPQPSHNLTSAVAELLFTKRFGFPFSIASQRQDDLGAQRYGELTAPTKVRIADDKARQAQARKLSTDIDRRVSATHVGSQRYLRQAALVDALKQQVATFALEHQMAMDAYFAETAHLEVLDDDLMPFPDDSHGSALKARLTEAESALRQMKNEPPHHTGENAIAANALAHAQDLLLDDHTQAGERLEHNILALDQSFDEAEAYKQQLVFDQTDAQDMLQAWDALDALPRAYTADLNHIEEFSYIMRDSSEGSGVYRHGLKTISVDSMRSTAFASESPAMAALALAGTTSIVRHEIGHAVMAEHAEIEALVGTLVKTHQTFGSVKSLLDPLTDTVEGQIADVDADPWAAPVLTHELPDGSGYLTYNSHYRQYQIFSKQAIEAVSVTSNYAAYSAYEFFAECFAYYYGLPRDKHGEVQGNKLSDAVTNLVTMGERL